MSDPVLLEIDDGVARVTLNRPESGNALDVETAHRLFDVVQEVAEDDEAHAVLLRGNGRIFCAGGDLLSMRTAKDRGAYVHELAGAAHDAIRALAGLQKPVVAAVQGSAAGAGLSLVLLSDLVIAAAGSNFVTAYTAVGLTPDCGQSWLLPRAIGTGKALDLMLTSRRVSAEDAVDLGIATETVAVEALDERADEIATSVAAGPSHALGKARWLIRRDDVAGLDARLDLETATIAEMASSDATGAMIDAYFDAHP